MLRFDKAVIIGATGPTGIHLAEALRGSVSGIRVVSRSEANLARDFSDGAFERVSADATDADQTLRAVDGCDLVFDCIGLPPALIHLHAKTAENVATAAAKTGARIVQVSSYWCYLPIVQLPLNEEHPRAGGPPYAVFRREAEDILESAGAAVLNIPDFYGPHVHTSTLQNALQDAAAGRAMNWIGRDDTEHEFSYVPDAMRIAVTIAGHEEAYGHRWVIPGAGPLTGSRLVKLVSQKLGTDVKLRAAAPWLLRIVSLFDADLRAFMPMVPHYARPISYDGAKLRRLLGEIETTTYTDGVGATLDWMTSR